MFLKIIILTIILWTLLIVLFDGKANAQSEEKCYYLKYRWIDYDVPIEGPDRRGIKKDEGISDWYFNSKEKCMKFVNDYCKHIPDSYMYYANDYQFIYYCVSCEIVFPERYKELEPPNINQNKNVNEPQNIDTNINEPIIRKPTTEENIYNTAVEAAPGVINAIDKFIERNQETNENDYEVEHKPEGFQSYDYSEDEWENESDSDDSQDNIDNAQNNDFTDYDEPTGLSNDNLTESEEPTGLSNDNLTESEEPTGWSEVEDGIESTQKDLDKINTAAKYFDNEQVGAFAGNASDVLKFGQTAIDGYELYKNPDDPDAAKKYAQDLENHISDLAQTTGVYGANALAPVDLWADTYTGLMSCMNSILTENRNIDCSSEVFTPMVNWFANSVGAGEVGDRFLNGKQMRNKYGPVKSTFLKFLYKIKE